MAKFYCRLHNQYWKTDLNLFFTGVGWCPDFFSHLHSVAHTTQVWYSVFLLKTSLSLVNAVLRRLAKYFFHSFFKIFHISSCHHSAAVWIFFFFNQDTFLSIPLLKMEKLSRDRALVLLPCMTLTLVLYCAQGCYFLTFLALLFSDFIAKDLYKGDTKLYIFIRD